MTQLTCGAAERVVTPRLGRHIPGIFKVRVASGIKSELKTHAIYLDDGKTALVIIHIDILDFQASLAKKIRRRLQDLMGIAPQNVMIAATHTHTGMPSNYYCLCCKQLSPAELENLIAKTVEAVLEARSRRVAVTARHAFGEEHGIAFNRNYRMKDGSIKTNPGKRYPFEVDSPLSPIDHTVGVIRFDDECGKPVAQLVNFACHADTVGGTEYCADYPGELCRLQQEKYGEDFVTVFLNGASGNVNHINAEWFKDPAFVLDKSTHYLHMGKVLSDNVDRLEGELIASSDTTLAARSRTYRTSRRQPTEKDLAWAREILQDPESSQTDRIYAREIQFLHKHPKKYAFVEIQAFLLGDCAIVTLPCEAYADIALAIRRDSPVKNLLISSLTNGTVGYVATEPAFSAGVYESLLSIYNSFLPPTAADEMADTAVRLLTKAVQKS